MSLAFQPRKGIFWISSLYFIVASTTLVFGFCQSVTGRIYVLKKRHFQPWGHFCPATANSIPIFALDRRDILVRVSVSAEVTFGTSAKV